MRGTKADFKQRLRRSFVLATMSSRSSVTPGLWTGTSCQTELSPGRTHSLSRSDKQASVDTTCYACKHVFACCWFCENPLWFFFCLFVLFFESACFVLSTAWRCRQIKKIESSTTCNFFFLSLLLLFHQGALSAIYSALRRCAPAPVLEPVQSSSLAQRRGMKKLGSPKVHPEPKDNE